jgi:hypothetical protein
VAYLLVGGGASAGTESQEGLESGHGFAPPVVAEHELVEVDLKLRAAHTMVRSHEPVLKAEKAARSFVEDLFDAAGWTSRPAGPPAPTRNSSRSCIRSPRPGHASRPRAGRPPPPDPIAKRPVKETVKNR